MEWNERIRIFLMKIKYKFFLLSINKQIQVALTKRDKTKEYQTIATLNKIRGETRTRETNEKFILDWTLCTLSWSTK